jgi:hypothetical protein
MKGKKRIRVVENKIYSELIFEIASGNNYSQKIYDSIKKPTSSIVKQLKILSEEGFVNSELIENKNIFPMKRIKKYSVNWEKIIEEFIEELKKKKKNIEETSLNIKKIFEEHLKETNNPNLEILKLLENKEFIDSLKINYYLRNFFKEFFISVCKIKKEITLFEIYQEILNFGCLEYVEGMDNLSLQKIFLKTMLILKPLVECSNEELIENVKNYQRIAQRIRKCKNNPEISQISKLNQILKLLRIDPKLRFPLCHSENLVSYDIFTKYLTKEEINKLEKEIKKGKISSETGIDKKLIKILRLFKEWKLKKNTPSKQKTKKEGEILTEQMQDKEFDKLNKDKKINRYSRIIEDNVRKGILDFCRIAKGLGQIQKKFGISTSSLMENISLLEKEGLIFKTSTNKIGAKNSKDKEIKIKTNLKKLKELETNGFKTPKTKQN